MSTLVILGAGSSFDSVAPHSIPGDANWQMRPPLAKDLFENRALFARVLDSIPHLGAIVASLRDRISRGRLVEDELAELERVAMTDPRATQQLMAVRFYLQQITRMCGEGWLQLAHGATNFHALVDAMVRWSSHTQEPVLLVTFNYDTMLERAIEQELAYAFADMGSYVARSDLKVFKLHGSVDWGHRGPADSLELTGAPGVIEHAAEVEISDTFEIKRDWNSGRGGDLWVPALAVPVGRKAMFECPAAHLEVLRDLLPSVNRLLVIGWAAMEDHFLNMFHERVSPQLQGFVIACGDSDASRETWSRVKRRADGPIDHGSWRSRCGE